MPCAHDALHTGLNVYLERNDDCSSGWEKKERKEDTLLYSVQMVVNLNIFEDMESDLKDVQMPWREEKMGR